MYNNARLILKSVGAVFRNCLNFENEMNKLNSALKLMKDKYASSLELYSDIYTKNGFSLVLECSGRKAIKNDNSNEVIIYKELSDGSWIKEELIEKEQSLNNKEVYKTLKF